MPAPSATYPQVSTGSGGARRSLLPHETRRDIRRKHPPPTVRAALEIMDADGPAYRGSISAALPRAAAGARSRRTPVFALTAATLVAIRRQVFQRRNNRRNLNETDAR